MIELTSFILQLNYVACYSLNRLQQNRYDEGRISDRQDGTEDSFSYLPLSGGSENNLRYTRKECEKGRINRDKQSLPCQPLEAPSLSLFEIFET